MTSPAPKPPVNTQIEMAKERNRLAADRTVLSWSRLGLALIGIGFGIDRTTSLIYATVGDAINPTRFSHILGLLLIGLGIYGIIMAALDYRGELNRLKQPDYRFTPRYRLGETVALALVAIAVLCAGHISLKLLL